jgi:hypothetical protein
LYLIIDAFSPDLLLGWRRALTFCKALPKKSLSLETSLICLGSGAVVLNITRQEPTEVPELWPCVVSGSIRVVVVVGRNMQRHGQSNLVLW